MLCRQLEVWITNGLEGLNLKVYAGDKAVAMFQLLLEPVPLSCSIRGVRKVRVEAHIQWQVLREALISPGQVQCLQP